MVPLEKKVMLFESRSCSSSAARNNNKRKGAFFILPRVDFLQQEKLEEKFINKSCNNNSLTVAREFFSLHGPLGVEQGDPVNRYKIQYDERIDHAL